MFVSLNGLYFPNLTSRTTSSPEDQKPIVEVTAAKR